MKKSVLSMIGCLILPVVLSAGLTVFAAGAGTAASEEASSGESASQIAESAKKEKKTKNSARVNVLSIAASVLGKTEAEIKEAVKTGKVGDLLIEAGKVDEFKAAYLAEMRQKLDAAVAEEKLTQEQADEKYAAAQEKMTAYDGTTHLCGDKDHSKMLEKKSKAHKSSASSTEE